VKIWVLGGKVSNADKSIPWQESIPFNLSNSDRLIIDLNTIPSSITLPLNEIRDYIRYMLMSGKELYVILSPASVKNSSNLQKMLPFYPTLVEVKPCDFDCINPLDWNEIPNEIVEYCKYVEHCPFYVNYINHNYLWNCLNPESGWNVPPKYSFSQQINSIRIIHNFEILNVSQQSIGLTSKYEILDNKPSVLHTTGQINFLPPSTKISSSEAIEVLVNSIIGVEFKEEEPKWVSKTYLPKIDELICQISAENKTIEETNQKIQRLDKEKDEIEKYRKLLWTYSKPLENAVKDALFLLGFGEIREGRSKELEDLVLDFKSDNKFVHGVIEVKGREKRTSLEDMNQCFKWVNQYRVQENKKVKGIFIPNQFRRTETLCSKKRVMFEPNEIEFAQDFDICVLPTSELFRAVVHVLKGNTISRNEIEKRILIANPVCRLL